MLQLAVFALFIFTNAHDERLKDADGNYIGRGCGTEEYMETLLANDPEWKQSLDDFETFWSARSKAIQSGEYSSSEQMSIAIPVIYHIVNQNPTSTPDSTIAAQTVQLQNDYSAQNNDYSSGTPVEFQNVRSGDFLFRVYTEQRINKVTNVNSFSANDAIKFDSQGGSNVVNPESNLNFWAGTLSGGLLGYAQFPGGNPSTDGVVHGLCTLGSIQNPGSCPPYNLGRTGTHEIGHWLNLRHIWGDNSGCTNTESISDFVIDTPPSSSSNFGCPAGTKRCSANPYSQDMYMNFMDYVEDNCMVMFTELQKQRAYASINQYRGGFSPAIAKHSNIEYVNWIYFTRYDEEPSDDMKCFGDHILFYDNNLNEESESNIYIYGCIQKTDFMTVGHLTDVLFIDGEKEECPNGYTQATQDLNEGNEGIIYLCYSKQDSIEENENMAVLDMTFVKDDDTSKLDDSWTVNTEDNINPNGIKLNFAIKKGKYFDETTFENASNGGTGNITQAEGTYIGIAVGLFILASIFIAVIVWRYVCSRKGFKEYMNESLSNEYGATTELTNMRV